MDTVSSRKGMIINMERMFLCNFKEYGVPNAPSMCESFEKTPYKGQDKIVKFLRSEGTVGAAAAAAPVDLFTGERISGELVFKNCGSFGWCSDLAYHVEKYNLRLPKEFEDFVLNRS